MGKHSGLGPDGIQFLSTRTVFEEAIAAARNYPRAADTYLKRVPGWAGLTSDELEALDAIDEAAFFLNAKDSEGFYTS